MLGPNGAGKTTTFYMIVGLVKANKGHIYLNVVNKDGLPKDGSYAQSLEITNMPMNERAKIGIGYLPQEASIFRKLSVEDNLKLVLEMNDSLNEEEKAQKLEDLLEEFGVKKLRTASAVSLSGG